MQKAFIQSLQFLQTPFPKTELDEFTEVNRVRLKWYYNFLIEHLLATSACLFECEDMLISDETSGRDDISEKVLKCTNTRYRRHRRHLQKLKTQALIDLSSPALNGPETKLLENFCVELLDFLEKEQHYLTKFLHCLKDYGDLSSALVMVQQFHASIVNRLVADTL